MLHGTRQNAANLVIVCNTDVLSFTSVVYFLAQKGFPKTCRKSFRLEIQPCKNETFIESVSTVAGVVAH